MTTFPSLSNDGQTEADDGVPLVMHARVVSGHGGGPEKTIFNSPRFLRELGYRGLCLYFRDPQDEKFQVLVRRAAEKRAPLESVDDFGLKDWKIIERVMERVNHHRPLIWHGHDYKSNLIGLLINRRLRRARGRSEAAPPMRLITTVHGWVQRTWKTPLYYFVDRRCLPRYDHVICVSRDLYDDCLRLGVQARSLSLIDNAIALDDYEFEADAVEVREQLQLPADLPMVIAVGRLSAEKGFDLLIRAVADLIDQGHDVALAIAGDGPQRRSLQSQIDELGHGRRIRLLGFVEDPRLVYRAATVFALSSHREGLPNAVLEAMTMRLPVVATRVAGMPSLIEDGVNGLLVEPGDLSALRNGLERVLTRPELASRLAQAGRVTIEERFSFRSRMEKVVATYALPC